MYVLNFTMYNEHFWPLFPWGIKCCDLFTLLSFVVFTGEQCHLSEKERFNPFDQIRKS